MKKLLLTTLTLAFGAQQMHAMEGFMTIPLTMEESEATAKKKQSKTSSELKSCAKDCVCAAKACCFACALCGLLTAPAMGAPIRAQQPWKRVASEGLPTTVKIEQTIRFNGISSTENGQVELPCFVNRRTKEFHCTYSVLEAFKFYEDNWPTDEDSSDLVRKNKED